MIRETHIDTDINRLQAHFGTRLIFQPPAPAADLAVLETLAGPLPRGLVQFLVTTNGLRVRLEEPNPFAAIWSTHDMLLCLRHAELPAMPDGFVPIAGGSDTQRDWIVLVPDSLHGVVIRCDPWAGDDVLLASSFGAYFNAWTRHLFEQFNPAGKPGSKSARIPFDGEYVGQCDEDVRRLAKDPRVQIVLGELRMTISAGADFE